MCSISGFSAASEKKLKRLVLQPKMDDDSRMSKKKVCLDANSDFISNLPENVINQILVRLPIRYAVRTSVLSRKWRYKWTTITQLVFHDRLILPSPHNNMNKLIYFIDRVLLLHTGVIHKFKLSSRCLQSFSTIDCWIRFLLRKNIQEFVFKLPHRGVEKYKLPSCFFSAQQISTLELHCCVLKPPPTFTGFSNLKTLYLHNTTFMDKGGFECLISKCPVLERLTWKIFDRIDHLTICSPNLKYLCLRGSFEDICFENTPLLSDVSICLIGDITDKMLEEFPRTETRNVIKVLSSLPNLKKFVVGRFFLKFLTVGRIPVKLPFTCHHLTNLSLDLNFEDVDEICVTLCLLNSSPNLRQLEIESDSRQWCHNIENLWEERTLIVPMSGLQFVKITNIEGFESELEFIKLLLANSPMLEMLSIRSGNLDIQVCAGLKFLKKLLIFPRASTKAKIKFLEEHEE